MGLGLKPLGVEGFASRGHGGFLASFQFVRVEYIYIYIYSDNLGNG